MADKDTPETPEQPTPEGKAPEQATPEAATPEAAAPAEGSSEQPQDVPQSVPQDVVEGEREPDAVEQHASEHAVPSAEAREIASVVEDVPLEALQEAEERAPDRSPATDAAAADQGQRQAVAAGEGSDVPGGEGSPAPAGPTAAGPDEENEEEREPAPRVKPSVPGAHLEVDIVPEGADPLGREERYADPYAIEDESEQAEEVEGAPRDEDEEVLSEPIATAAIDLAAGARYRATGKRKTAIARVTLRPGTGTYLVNGRGLEEHFPRVTLQRNIRQPLETVGYQERMDVVARLHGGGISAQAGALRHGVSRALLEADPNLRGELKRRGFLTRDSRAKERKKAGLKKARKRPQFSKR